VSPPLPETAPGARSRLRICRIVGCQEQAGERSFCPACWRQYVRLRRHAEAELEISALAVRAEVEDGLDGVPTLWDAMALNLAAWRSLPVDERGRARSAWWRALVDTIAEAVGL
jgi:hypothetical protein